MEEIILTDITGTIGEWLDYGFDDEVPYEVIKLLEKAYALAAKGLDKPLDMKE
jgi:predicted DNA-binding protein (MmcQ/YjbR family)